MKFSTKHTDLQSEKWRIFEVFQEKSLSIENARYPVKMVMKELIEKYGNISYDGLDVNYVINNLVEDFFQGIPIYLLLKRMRYH